VKGRGSGSGDHATKATKIKAKEAENIRTNEQFARSWTPRMPWKRKAGGRILQASWGRWGPFSESQSIDVENENDRASTLMTIMIIIMKS